MHNEFGTAFHFETVLKCHSLVEGLMPTSA